MLYSSLEACVTLQALSLEQVFGDLGADLDARVAEVVIVPELYAWIPVSPSARWPR